MDAGQPRIAKIEKLIEDCPFGIHDISRTELNENGLPRFNMPLELGLFLGAKRYGDTRQTRKRCLVMDTAPYRYQQFMSDIAGQDIEAHGGDIRTLIEKVRLFLNASKRGKPLPSGTVIASDYEAFLAALPGTCQLLQVEAASLDFKDFAWIAAQWVPTH